MPVFIICISWSLLRVHVVSSLLNIGKNLINLQFFREIFAVCVQTFGSSDRANSCSGTLPVNFVIEFVTSRLEAGHYTGSTAGIAKYLDRVNDQCSVCMSSTVIWTHTKLWGAACISASVTGTGCLFVLTNESGKVGTNASFPAALQERQWGKEVGAG